MGCAAERLYGERDAVRPRRRRGRVFRRRRGRPPIPPATGSRGRGGSKVQRAARNVDEVPELAILPGADGGSPRTSPESPPDSSSRTCSPRRGPECTPA